MRGFGIKTRIVLIGVIALILCGYGWWYFAPARPVVPELEIEVSQTEAGLVPGREAEELARLPLFDAATGGWIVGGKVLHSLTKNGVVPTHNDPWGPDDVGRMLRVRLPEGAGKGIMQAAMRALAAEDICQVAMFAPGVKSIMVVRILRVADGRGGATACNHDRFNPPSL